MPSPSPSSSVASSSMPEGTAAIAIQSFTFSAQTLTVKQGTTVMWTNNDHTNHTVTGDTSAEFKSAAIPASHSFAFTFTEVGTFPYHCAIHPGMTGVVVVMP